MAIYKDYRTPQTTVVDAAAINNSIRNILMTPKGSLPGKPTFGSRINEVLFGQMDYITMNAIEDLIKEALNKWEPRIIINRIDIKQVSEYNKITATIDYNYVDVGLNINEKISIAFTI